MITWRRGTVLTLGNRWGVAPSRAWEATVRLAEPLRHTPVGSAGLAGAATDVRALAYPDMVGEIRVGDTVLLNCSALDRGLGTGGYALIVANEAVPPDPPEGPGHLVKARYTPLQAMVLGVDDQESPHHETLERADDVGRMPVVVADLHSAMPAIAVGARYAATLAGRPAPRIAYVMTDGGALPVAFSRTVATLREAGWLTSVITVGQTFGGDLEAVTIHTGLLAARLVAGAHIAIVAQGPGNLGTGTRWGFSGVAAGEAINAAATLRGLPVAALRVSGADPRERHLGVSHHSLTAYSRVAMARADVPIPVPTPSVESLPTWGKALTAQIRREAATLGSQHRLVDTPAGPELVNALRECPVPLRTMGRSLDDDPAAFVASAVAGIHALGLAAKG